MYDENFGDVDMDPNNFDFNEVIDVRQLLQLGDEFLNVAPMPNQPNQPNFWRYVKQKGKAV